MEEIEWCKEQRKGIRLVDPNSNLSLAYLKKAEEALETMNSVTSPDWIISTGYYSMYYSLYAVLMKIGIRSEMHTCTIECMREYLMNFFSYEDVRTIDDARIMRVQSQYSVALESAEEEASKIVSNVPYFLLKCRNVCNRMKSEDIENIRKMLSDNHKNNGKNNKN